MRFLTFIINEVGFILRAETTSYFKGKILPYQPLIIFRYFSLTFLSVFSTVFSSVLEGRIPGQGTISRPTL